MLKNRKKIQIFPIICIVLLAFALWAVGDGVYAKYVKNNDASGAVKAKAFYFESDLLTDETPEYTVTADTTEILFSVENYLDALRFTEDDIEYTVNVTWESDADGCELELSGGSDSDGSASVVVSELPGGVISQHMVTLRDLEPGAAYKVTVNGVAGYKADLSAVFKVASDKTGVYKHVTGLSDASPEVILTVWTENASGDVKLTFDSKGLIPDNTAPELATLNNLNGSTYDPFTGHNAGSLGVYSSQTYRFFKDGTFAGGEFTVTVGETVAIDSVP